jgi:hypothetical protein
MVGRVGLDEVIASIPPERYEDVIIFDETIAFNPLRTTDIPTTATAVLDALKSAWHYEGSTPILDLYTYNATASLSYTQDASLLGVIYLLTDTSYRTQVQGYIKDPLLRKFWTDYDQLPQKEQRQQTLSTLNKFYALFTDPTFRNCLGHKLQKCCMHTIFTEVVCNTCRILTAGGSFLWWLCLTDNHKLTECRLLGDCEYRHTIHTPRHAQCLPDG